MNNEICQVCNYSSQQAFNSLFYKFSIKFTIRNLSIDLLKYIYSFLINNKCHKIKIINKTNLKSLNICTICFQLGLIKYDYSLKKIPKYYNDIYYFNIHPFVIQKALFNSKKNKDSLKKIYFQLFLSNNFYLQ